MVLYGIVWYGVIQLDPGELCLLPHWRPMLVDMASFGMVWHGMVWYGIVWYGMVWYGLV